MTREIGEARMVRLGVIGVGAWGKKLIRAVQSVSDTVHVAAGCTRTVAKAEPFADAMGMRLYGSLDELFADPAIDAIVSTGPADLHAEHAMAALRAGFPVMAVKPLALLAEDARALGALAEERKLLLALGYNRYFFPSNQELHRVVRAGDIGTVLHAQGSFCTDRFHLLPRDHWALLDENILAGALADHPLYSMIEMMGPVAEVDARSGRGGTDLGIIDTTAVLLRFANGATGLLTAMGATAPYERLTYFGSRGWAEVAGPELRVADGAGVVSTPVLPDGDAERAQLECFADAVTGRLSFPITVGEAVHGVEVLAAMNRSAHSNRPVAV